MSQRYLLDTNAFLWALEGNAALGKKSRTEIERLDTQIFISDIVLLEIAIKVRSKHLRLSVTMRDIAHYLKNNAIDVLYFDTWTAEQYVDSFTLDWNDPLDRAHISLAAAHNLTLMTSDQHILASNAVRCMDACT